MIQMPTNAIKVIFLASCKMEKNKIDVRILGLQRGTKKTLIQHYVDSNFSQFWFLSQMLYNMECFKRLLQILQEVVSENS